MPFKVKLALISVIILLLAAIVWIVVSTIGFESTSDTISDLPPASLFDIHELDFEAQSATVIGRNNTINRSVFLTFDGLSDFQTTSDILDILDVRGVTASFFLPGRKSMEFPEVVNLIQNRGHHIGNYGLNAIPHMENMNRADLAADFVTAQSILDFITGNVPDFFKARSAVYTETILEAAASAGLRYAVNSDIYLSFQSFRNRQQAYEFVSAMDNGVVLSVVVDRVLDEMEFYGIQTESALITAPTLDADDRAWLVTMVSYLLDAFSEQGYRVFPVTDILRYDTSR